MAVSKDDLFVAINWLDLNEGAEDAPACARVARFLEAELAKREARSRRALQVLREQGQAV